MQVTTYGLDLAKSVMQLHWVDMETGEIHRKQLKRRALLEFFANRQLSISACDWSVFSRDQRQDHSPKTRQYSDNSYSRSAS